MTDRAIASRAKGKANLAGFGRYVYDEIFARDARGRQSSMAMTAELPSDSIRRPCSTIQPIRS